MERQVSSNSEECNAQAPVGQVSPKAEECKAQAPERQVSPKSEESKAQAPVGQGARLSQQTLHSELTHNISQVLDMEVERALPWTQKLAIRILMAPAFDHALGIVILANMFVMIIETDQLAKEEKPVSSGPSWTEICGWLALTIFVLELLLRLFAFRRLFWKDAWNTFDFLVVVTDASFSIVGLVAGDAFPVSILRIFRLAKLARVSKVLRKFPELRLLLAALMGSLRAIFWGIVLLLFVLIVWSMMAVLFIHPLVKDMGCEECPFAYDSVFHASLTFWQNVVAGDSGEVIVGVVRIYPVTIIFFLPLFMTIGMAVMNLILGVVVEVAMEAKDRIAHEDDVEMKMLKMERHTHLLDICHKMDVHKTGRLSQEDVFAAFATPGEFQEHVRSMDIKEEDLQIVWSILDPENIGSLPYKTLLNKLYAVKESDSQFMLAYVKYFVTSIKSDILRMMSRMESKLEEDMQNVEKLEGKLVEELEEEGMHMFKQFTPNSAEMEVTQEHQMGSNAHGVWQVLHESKRKLNGVQDTMEVNSKGRSSVPAAKSSPERLADDMALQASLRSAASTSVNDVKGVVDKKFAHDIDTLKTELQRMLIDMNQKLGSQVSLLSLMYQKVCMASSEAIVQGGLAKAFPLGL